MKDTAPSILVSHVSKSFGSNKVLRSVDLSVSQGDIYALVGPNGSGKTTLVKIMVGLLSADVGKVKLLDYDIKEKPLEAKQTFGYVSDNPSGYDYLTGSEFLSFAANLKKASYSSSLFPITDVLTQPMAHYSRGNLQKVAFLSALTGTPQILIIDEPVVGLDPGSISILGDKLRSFAKSGGTVFLVTHTLSFAKEYATRFGLLKSGSLVAEGDIKPSLDLESIYQQKVLNE